MNTLKLKKVEGGRTRKARRAISQKQAVGFWEFLVTLIKYLDNFICHGLAFHGAICILKDIGVVAAMFHHFTNWGVK